MKTSQAFYGIPVAPPSKYRSRPVVAATPAKRSQAGFSLAENDRLLGDWVLGPVSNERILRSQLVTMRARSRDLARNDDYFKGFLRLLQSNVIGPQGFVLDLDVFNGDGSPDNDLIETVKKEWREFSRPENFTTSGKFSRSTFESLLFRTIATDGESLFEGVEGFPGNKWGFALRPWEVDHLDEGKNEILRDGRRISMGVEYDEWDKPSRYWLRQWNPGDTELGIGAGRKTEPVDADGFKHLFIPDYWDQSRGIPWAHAAGKRMHMLGGYEEAALEASRGGAAKHGYFEQLPDAAGTYTGDEIDSTGNWLEDMAPGQKEILPRGIKYHEVDPAFPQQSHGDFVKVMLRGIAASLGAAYPSLANDLEGVSWSSIRSGEIKERDAFKILQAWGSIFYADWTFRRWLANSLLRGALVLSNGRRIPPSRFEKIAAGARFKGKRWQWVDPLKEQQANKLALENRTTSRAEIISESSQMDIEDVFLQIGRERELALAAGLDLPEDVQLAAKKPPTPAGGEDPEEEDAEGEGEDGNSPEEERATQIFGYHLENAIVRINEARERLGLPPIDGGNVTVPEFLAALKKAGETPEAVPSADGDNQPQPAGAPADSAGEDGDEGGGEGGDD